MNIELNPLDPSSIARAIEVLDKYRKWLENGSKKLVQELAQFGAEHAELEVKNALYAGTNDVSVHFESRGDKEAAVVALGNATLFIEFGTGITYTSPGHPEAGGLGMTRGSYGSGLGKLKNGWRYKGPEGNMGYPDDKHPGYTHTMGNPANMFMWKSKKDIEESFTEIAKRCFGEFKA